MADFAAEELATGRAAELSAQTATASELLFQVAGTPDLVAPSVSGEEPAPGVVGESQTIQFDVTDDLLVLGGVVVSIGFTGAKGGITEIVHDGDSFVAPYVSNSTRTPIATGYRFILVRADGWPDDFAIKVTAVDAAGNRLVTTRSYTLNVVGRPLISAISPPVGSAIGRQTPISLTVTGPAPLRRVVVMASFPSTGKELVYDGEAFAVPYDNPTTGAASVAGGIQFTVLRTGGWPEAPTLYPVAVDVVGASENA